MSSISSTLSNNSDNDSMYTNNGETVNFTKDSNTPTTELNTTSETEIKNQFAAAAMISGFASADDSNYYRCYNSLHDLPYFTPHSTGNLHIFITRPQLNLSPANLSMSNEMLQCCHSPEGALLLASLTDNLHKNLDYYDTTDPAGTEENSKFSKLTEVYKSIKLDGELPGGDETSGAFQNLKIYGLNKLGNTPFIPLMSNLSVSINGMKDFVIEKYEYDGDQAGNKTADPMGMDESKSSGECTIGCIETSNLSVSMLNYMWELYMDLTGKGLMNPTYETMNELSYDFMSSIYWFVTGRDGLSIKLYGKMTGCYPINVPITSLIPSERGSPTNSRIDFIYHYNHHEIMNPEILYDFNFIIDKAMQSVSSSYLENKPVYNNTIIDNWVTNNFLLDPENPNSYINKKYNRMMPTGNNNGVTQYNRQIFQPNIQNEWLGHPYVYNGMLVYRSIPGKNETQLEASFDTIKTASVNNSINGLKNTSASQTYLSKNLK